MEADFIFQYRRTSFSKTLAGVISVLARESWQDESRYLSEKTVFVENEHRGEHVLRLHIYLAKLSLRALRGPIFQSVDDMI
jgi:hypothetical protein